MAAIVAGITCAFSACSDDEPEVPETPVNPGKPNPPEPPEPTVNVFDVPANTYIVSEAGDYEFYTKKVSGSEIEGVASVDWIWATKQAEEDTEQILISDIAYADGKVSFTATGEEGNVVIAAFNEAGKIVWEWLIWCTDQPEDIEFASGAVFGDRFIGATSCKPEDGTKTWGCITYQWGRLAPIFSGYADEWGEAELFNEARKWTVMNPTYGLEWTVSNDKTTVEEAIANPTTFYVGENSGQWLNEENQELWGKTKTDYDPSPAGYRLTSSEDWGDDFLASLYIYSDYSGATYTHNGKSIYFPNGVKNRIYDSGACVVGYPGVQSYNCEYMMNDPMGFTALIGQPGYEHVTIEFLIQMGFVNFCPSRLAVQYEEGTVSGVNVATNPSFSIPVHYVKVQ